MLTNVWIDVEKQKKFVDFFAVLHYYLNY